MTTNLPDIDLTLGAKEKVKTRFLLVPEDALRFNNLNFIRSLLALVVLFCHCFVIYYGTEKEVEPFYVWSDGQISMGTFAVNYFFVISGFLILLSWDKQPKLGKYLWKRIIRIYPAFIVVSLLCLFLFAPLGTGDFFRPFGYWQLYFKSIDWELIPKNLLLLNEPRAPWVFKNAPITNSLNASLWTIKFEFMCYLIIPLLALIGMFRSRIFSAILFVEVYVIYVYQYYTNSTFWGWQEFPIIGKPDMLIQFLTFFSAGMALYMYRELIPRSRWFFLVSVIAMIVSMFFVKALVVTLPIFGSYVLFHIAFARSYSLKGFAKWGDFSYGIYLFAWPIQQLILLYLEKYMDVALLFILSTSITLCFAFVSWHYIEQPSLRLKNFSFKKKKVETI